MRTEKKNPDKEKRIPVWKELFGPEFCIGDGPEPKYDVFLCQEQKYPGATPPEPKNSGQSANSDDLGK